MLPVLLLRLANSPAAVRLDNGRWVRDEGEYVGAEACRDCHASIVEKQLASSHANTVRDLSRDAPRAPFDTEQKVVDPLTGARYSMGREKGHPVIRLETGGQSASEKLDFEFGSGAHAFGYLAQVDHSTWIDARLNYYEKIHAWDFTSSQDKPQPYLLTQPLGRPQTPDSAARCFGCHSTLVRAHLAQGDTEPGADLRVRPDRSLLNVTCESCHGPMGKHVRERRAGGAVEKKAPLSADQMNQVCGRCHGLSDIDQAHPVIARFQPWGLGQSTCFRASAGRLSCVSCHDPHTNVRKDEAFYVTKCLSCHSRSASSPPSTVCPVNPRSGCVGCHMPRDSKSMSHITFTDHRIRIVPNSVSPQP